MFLKILRQLSGIAWIFLLRVNILAADPEIDSTQLLADHEHHFLTLWHDYVLIALIVSLIVLLVINYYRVKGRKALQESESRFKALAERSVVGINVIQDDVLKFANPRLAEMLGHTEAELINIMGPADFVHPDDITRVRQSMHKRIAGEEEFAHYEARVVTKAGDIRDVEVFGSRMMYQGRPAVIATLLDITDRKKTAKDLEKAHSDLEQIFNSAAPLYVINRDFTIERVNDTFCFHIGLKPKEVTGRKCYDVWPGRKCNTPECALRAILAGEERLTYEREHVHVDGHKTAFTATALPYYGVDGSVQGIIASFGDISELKLREKALRESEEKSRAQFQSIPVPTYVWQWMDDDFVFIDYNEEAMKITGGVLPDLLGSTLHTAFSHKPFWRESMLQCLREKTTIRIEKPEVYKYRPTGETKYLAISYAYMPPDFVLVHTADVTARTEAEKALQESESRFRELAEKAPVGIYLIWDAGVKYANPAVAKIVGYSAEELVGLSNPIEIVHPEDRQEAMDTLAAFMRGDIDTARYEIRVTAKNGTLKHLEISASPAQYQGNAAIIGTVLDITERKIAEDALKESERKFRTLAETTRASIIIYSEEGTVYTNPAAEIVSGYTKEELSRMNLWDIARPDYQQMLQERAATRVAGDFENPSDFEIPIVTKAGQERWIVYSAGIIHYGGKPAVLGTGFDITERKKAEAALAESEEKFRLAMEATNDALWDWNLQTNKTYRNPRHATMLGFTPEEFSSEQSEWEERIHPDDREGVLTVLETHLRKETDEIHIEYRLRTKSGDYIWVLGRGKVIEHDDKGMPVRMLGTNIDITERKMAEAALQQAHQERYEQVRQVAGGVAHEIHNALFPAASTLDKLKERLSPAREADNGRNMKLVELADNSVSRAIDMTELVTQFSKLDTDKNVESIDLREVFEEILKDQVRVGELKAEVDLRVDDNSVVKMSRVHAYSLFNNLISNALDAVEESEKRAIRIRAAQNGEYVKVRVSDTGQGIDSELLPKIFSPFFSTKPRKGTGLGLAICKRIVDIYKGEITVDSGLDRGTSFTILLKT